MGKWLASGCRVADGDEAGGLALGLADSLAAPLDRAVGAGEMLPAGEKVGTEGLGADPVQPETAAAANTVMAPHEAAISLARSPTRISRTP